MCELADEAVQVGSPGGHAVRIVLDSAFGRSDDTAQAKKSGRAVSARDVDALTEIIDGCARGREIYAGPVRPVETLRCNPKRVRRTRPGSRHRHLPPSLCSPSASRGGLSDSISSRPTWRPPPSARPADRILSSSLPRGRPRLRSSWSCFSTPAWAACARSCPGSCCGDAQRAGWCSSCFFCRWFSSRAR